jgi:hypothetical protein
MTDAPSLNLDELVDLARRHVRPDFWPDPIAARDMASKYPATFLHLIQLAEASGAAAMKPQPLRNA